MTLEEQYYVISKEIEEENKSEMDFLISSLAASITNDSNNVTDDSEIERNHLENITALLSLRVAVAIPLINNGMTEWQPQLEEDINATLEKICSIEYEWELNDDIIDHFADLITVISPNNRETIKPILKNRYKHRFRRTKEISSGLFSLFISVALAFQRLNKPDLFSAALEGLCNLSRERNGKALHREVVYRVLSTICDSAPETSIRIAQRNLTYFENTKDDYAGDFYWFYACALQQLKKNSEAISNFEVCYRIREAILGEGDWGILLSPKENQVFFNILHLVEKPNLTICWHLSMILKTENLMRLMKNN